MKEFNTPVLLLVFNRPDTTTKVLKAIAEVQPKYLYVVADGPRVGNAEDIELCTVTRKLVEDSITWPAEVKTLFRTENLGCGKGPADAITWFFSHVTEGIILEDDCIANTSFFKYCQELLEYYRTEKQIMHIGGTNFQSPDKNYAVSYYFSSIAHGWGWATWKRAWDKFSFEINDLPAFIAAGTISKYHNDSKIIEYWYGVFRNVGREDLAAVWDHQWTYSIWKNGGLSIIPAVNMVSNIGYGANATHTKEFGSWSNIPTKQLSDVKHPDKIAQDRQADDYTYYHLYAPSLPAVEAPTLTQRFKRSVRLILNYLTSVFLASTESFLLKHSSLYIRRRSLLFLKVDSIGDYILVRNFIECLKRSAKYKDYSITLCGNESCKSLAESLDSKYIKRFIWVDYLRMYQQRRYRLKKHLQIFFSGFEVLIHPIFSRSSVGDDIVKYSGAKYRIGFTGDYANLPENESKFNNKWYSQLININSDLKFEFEKNKAFFKAILGDFSIFKPTIPFRKVTEEYVVICPGAQKKFRQWSPQNFAKLCDLIGTEYGGKFVIAGSNADVPLANEIKQRSQQQFIDCTGKKNISDLIEIFAGARLIITNDSGPLHIAFAMNKNVVGISNGHHYQRFTPYPAYMNLKGTCIYPKDINEQAAISATEEQLPDINVIEPEAVYEIITKKYFVKNEITISNNN